MSGFKYEFLTIFLYFVREVNDNDNDWDIKKKNKTFKALKPTGKSWSPKPINLPIKNSIETLVIRAGNKPIINPKSVFWI